MVEMGTFVAILLGQVAGGLRVAIPAVGPHCVAFACVGVALIGRLVAQSIPASPSTDPGLRINWNPVTETWRNLTLARQNIVVFRSLLGIGELGEFKGGVMKLLEGNPVPVVPLALQNLWGSYFSRAGGSAMSKPFRRGWFSRVGLVAGNALAPAGVTPAALRDRVSVLLAS